MKAAAPKRMLYISPLDVRANNGMLQRQLQLLLACADYYDRLDILTLHSSPRVVRDWLADVNLAANVLVSPFAGLARWNALLWYYGNEALCNRLALFSNFRFPIRTPLPAKWAASYDSILCYYPWAFVLLELDRWADKVTVDMGDVMTERHARIGSRQWISLSAATERSIVRSRAKVLAISRIDQAEFETRYGVHLPILPVLHPSHRELMGLAPPRAGNEIGYLGGGGFQNEATAEAITSPDFLRSLQGAGLKLRIAGTICRSLSAKQIARVKGAGGIIQGPVGKLGDFYSNVAIVLNPIGPSTGIKLKSVEALLAGRCLVTSQYGVDAQLLEFFGDQIVTVDWPMRGNQLFEGVKQALDHCRRRADFGRSAERFTDAARAAAVELLQ